MRSRFCVGLPGVSRRRFGVLVKRIRRDVGSSLSAQCKPRRRSSIVGLPVRQFMSATVRGSISTRTGCAIGAIVRFDSCQPTDGENPRRLSLLRAAKCGQSQ